MTSTVERLRALPPYAGILALLVASLVLVAGIAAGRTVAPPIARDAAVTQVRVDASAESSGAITQVAIASAETEDSPAEAMIGGPASRSGPVAGLIVRPARADLQPASTAPGWPERPPRAA